MLEHASLTRLERDLRVAPAHARVAGALLSPRPARGVGPESAGRRAGRRRLGRGGTAGAAAPMGMPLWAFEHVVPDSAAGDTLGIDAAQLLASDFLRVQGIEPADLDLKESRSERQKARTDHTFEWQVPDSTLGEAGVRYMVVVRGGEVAGLRPYIHLPGGVAARLQRALGAAADPLGAVARRARGRVPGHRHALRPRGPRAPFSLGRRACAGARRRRPCRSCSWDCAGSSDIVMRYETTMPYRLFLVGAGVSIVVQVLMVGPGGRGARGHAVRDPAAEPRAVRGRTRPPRGSRRAVAGARRRRAAGRRAAVGHRADGCRRALRVLRRAAAAARRGAPAAVARRLARPVAQHAADVAGTRAARAPDGPALRGAARRRLPGARRAAVRGGRGTLPGRVRPAARDRWRERGAAGLRLRLSLPRQRPGVRAGVPGGRGLASAAAWLQQPEPGIRVTGAIVAALLVATSWWCGRPGDVEWCSRRRRAESRRGRPTRRARRAAPRPRRRCDRAAASRARTRRGD